MWKMVATPSYGWHDFFGLGSRPVWDAAAWRGAGVVGAGGVVTIKVEIGRLLLTWRLRRRQCGGGGGGGGGGARRRAAAGAVMLPLAARARAGARTRRYRVAGTKDGSKHPGIADVTPTPARRWQCRGRGTAGGAAAALRDDAETAPWRGGGLQPAARDTRTPTRAPPTRAGAPLQVQSAVISVV